MTLIGEHHEIVRFIAEGASSDVYEARDLRTGASVAIKVMRQSDTEDSEPREQFETEASAFRHLDSPYLVRLLETGRDCGRRPFLVLELLTGTTLKERLARYGRLGIDAALQIGRELFLALDAVHRAGFVHRDVKPRNVVLHERADGCSIKLLDFGISEPLRPNGRRRSDLAMGTPAYMSPEQLAGFAVDERADIYSGGVMLYEMVTGRRPFEAADLEMLARSIMLEPVLPPSLLRPRCPLALEELILRTLERDRRQRPRTARTVAEALDGIAIGLGCKRGTGAHHVLPSTPPPSATHAHSNTLRLPSRPPR